LLFRPRAPAPPKALPVSVSAARAVLSDVPVSIQTIGAAQAWHSVTIRAQVNGRLQRVPVQEGAEVRQGDLIAEIDPAPYQAVLMQAQGALKRDQAQLELARLDLTRYRQLEAQNSISAQQVDTEQALVRQLEGTVLIDQGAVASAQVNLAYCRITSPVTGRVGVRLVDPGNLVTTTDAGGIIVINQLEPIAVTFSVPQADFQRLVGVSSFFRRALATQAFSQDSGAPLGAGELSIADNHVDASSGTVQMKARFLNAERKLWPGQFVNVRLTLNVLHGVVTIPKSAINRGPEFTYAYVIGADKRVAVRPITVDLIQDSDAVISAGLRAGETVVTDGQMSLKPGSLVSVRSTEAASSAGVTGPSS
jgi:multidrug efflux system membrane fusion protein